MLILSISSPGFHYTGNVYYLYWRKTALLMSLSMTLCLKPILMHIHVRFNSRLCHRIIKHTSHIAEKQLCSKEKKSAVSYQQRAVYLTLRLRFETFFFWQMRRVLQCTLKKLRTLKIISKCNNLRTKSTHFEKKKTIQSA